ncbi:Sulfite efflux pump SSU1 {ECO:0000303/PubMed:17322211} [Serendipita indica DSM 11827]|uniref:Related to malic acid transport protein n=1 Tax=Serendipita indica (strain DSM 11827) TaxID=1109443 RepID=G4T8F2_SERID|nr:Sulfite efflux pump SSU1 {ECO:0000303/PubMed:17322211} [Serendipita indica DSM 11827]CCA67577.1 related to malic acid transport protein [Serendipita indica DSM 11827]
MPEERKSLLDRIRHFTPSWFAVTMGTGVVGILIYNLPYGNDKARHLVSLAFLILNSVLFAAFTLISALRYIIFPGIWSLMIREPTQSLFLSCFPMSLSTVISASISLSLHRDIPGLIPFLWILWWINVMLSMLSGIGLPYLMITRHKLQWEHHNATWLLPVVPNIVCASCGGVFTNALIDSDPYKAKLTVATSLMILAMGLCTSIMIATTYVFRLFAHGFPSAGLVVSLLIPLGPCGQGGYALLLLSNHLATLSSSLGIDGAFYGKVFIVLGASGALTLWSIGLWFGIIATIGLVEAAIRYRIPFRINYWGTIFPTGVYSLLTMQLGHNLDVSFFRIIGTIFSTITGLLWLGIAIKTCYHTFEGSIFHAPCLDDTPNTRPWRKHSPEDTQVELTQVNGGQQL